jgi:hypothetical protein
MQFLFIIIVLLASPAQAYEQPPRPTGYAEAAATKVSVQTTRIAEHRPTVTPTVTPVPYPAPYPAPYPEPPVQPYPEPEAVTVNYTFWYRIIEWLWR